MSILNQFILTSSQNRIIIKKEVLLWCYLPIQIIYVAKKFYKIVLMHQLGSFPDLLLPTNKTHHSHDKVYRDLLSNKQEFHLFLKDFFSYTLKYNVEKYNRNFITRDYSDKYSDIVFKLNNYPAYILLEHQSSKDNSIAYRLYKYYNLILEDSVDEVKLHTKNYKIPLITPILLYTGNKPWNFVPNFALHQFDLEYNDNLSNGKLSLTYNFININDFSREELLKKHSMIAYVMAIDKCSSLLELIDTINIVFDLCNNRQKDYLYRIIIYILKPVIPKEIYDGLIKKFNKEEDMYMEELIERIKADERCRRKKAIHEGRAEGIKQGIKQGMKQGRLQNSIETAKKMLERNMLIEDISDITGLSVEEINNLKFA